MKPDNDSSWSQCFRAQVRLHLDASVAFVLAFLSFLVYLRTLAPDVVDADGGELQFAAWNFSFVHPTGYPLYLLLGGSFQHLLPFGNPAFRLNVFTALTAALAVGVVYLAANALTHHRASAAVAAAAFALTRTFWFDASGAETYALNAFFVALLIYLALRWQAAPSAKTFAVFALVYGLALTHHRTIALWLPAFALFFAAVALKIRTTHHAPRITWSVFRLTGLFLLPLLLYLYIPLRAPTSPYAVLPLAPGRGVVLYDNSPVGLVNYLLGRVFQSELRWDAVSIARLASLPPSLSEQFGVVGIALGLAGIAAMLWRREWARFVFLAFGAATTVLFASFYHIGDIFHYYIPAYLVWALWVGTGVHEIVELVTSRVSAISRTQVAAFCLLFSAFLLLPVQFTNNLSAADRSQETRERTQWTGILSAPVPPNAILISNDRDEMMPLWYMQYVENTRRDVLGLFPLLTPAPEYANIGRLTDTVLDTGRTIYFIKPMPGIEIKYRVAAKPPLVQVLGRAADASPQFASTAVLANQVRVMGYSATYAPHELRVVIYWQPRAKLAQDYTSFVHLLDSNGNKIAQGNDHAVGGDYYPTSMWEIGETLVDAQTISLPPDLAPGTYHLVVGMYAQPDSQMLGEPVEMGPIALP